MQNKYPNGTTVKEARHQAHPVLRRHAYNGQVTDSCLRTFHTIAEVSGVHHQHAVLLLLCTIHVDIA